MGTSYNGEYGPKSSTGSNKYSSVCWWEAGEGSHPYCLSTDSYWLVWHHEGRLNFGDKHKPPVTSLGVEYWSISQSKWDQLTFIILYIFHTRWMAMTGWYLIFHTRPMWAECVCFRYSCLSVTSADSGSRCHQPPADHRLLCWTRINTETQHHKFMKQMYLPLKFTMAFKAAPHKPGLKINITLMTPCNCLLNSSDKPAEWTEALNSVSLSLQWQLLCRD